MRQWKQFTVVVMQGLTAYGLLAIMVVMGLNNVPVDVYFPEDDEPKQTQPVDKLFMPDKPGCYRQQAKYLIPDKLVMREDGTDNHIKVDFQKGWEYSEAGTHWVVKFCYREV